MCDVFSAVSVTFGYLFGDIFVQFGTTGDQVGDKGGRKGDPGEAGVSKVDF